MRNSKVTFLVAVILISVAVSLIMFKLPVAQTAEAPSSGSPQQSGLKQVAIQTGCAPMTNSEFVSAIIKALGIKMPEDAGNLSQAELFEVQVNILAERGLDYFVNAYAQTKVTKGELCKIFQALNETVMQTTNTSSGRGSVTNPFYDPISGYAKTPPQTDSYVEQFGCAVDTGVNDIVCAKDILAVLGSPEYSTLVAEAYSYPRGMGRPALILPPQNPIPEDDLGIPETEEAASRIQCSGV